MPIVACGFGKSPYRTTRTGWRVLDMSTTIQTGPFKAIFAKYIGPTNRRGSRVKAYDLDGNSVTVSYDDSLPHGQAYEKAVLALCDKMEWHGHLVGGGTKEGEVYVFVEPQPNTVTVECANSEDAAYLAKYLGEQAANKDRQTLHGAVAGIVRSAVQRAVSVKGGAQ